MDKKDDTPKKKIELPSSGLAEDILGALQPDDPGALDAPEPGEEKDWEDAVREMDEYSSEKQEEDESLHLVGFFLSGEEYALDIAKVQEIIRVGGWTRVPNAPDHIKGVINLRGRIIPVVDPKVRMGFETGGLSKDSRIVVMEAGKKIIGMLVDRVSQVIRLPLKTVESAPEEVSEADKGFVTGVGKMDGRLILLLDLDKVLGREDRAA